MCAYIDRYKHYTFQAKNCIGANKAFKLENDTLWVEIKLKHAQI